MAETHSMVGSSRGLAPILGAFVAGFIAVPVFHQIALEILHLLGMGPAPYSMRPLPPFDVPQVLSQSFWGGVWGIVLALVLARRQGAQYWVTAVVFGAVALTLVAWFVVPAIKGLPVTAPGSYVIGPVVNGAWGFGVALILKLMPPRYVWR